jgi:hypothetical protein
MRVRLIIDADVNSDLFAQVEDGYGTGASEIARAVRRDLVPNEYLLRVDSARIQVFVGEPGEQPTATAISYQGRTP